MGREIVTQLQKAESQARKTQGGTHQDSNFCQKDKNKTLKATRGKQQVTYMGIPIKLSVDFSAETLQARREQCEILKVPKEENLQTRILYLARLSLIAERERTQPSKN